MFSAIKRLTGQAVTYGLGHVMTRFVPFLLLPVFTHHLPPGQYGVQTLYYMLIAVMMEVVRLGQDIALLRYYVLEKDSDRRKVIFSTVFWGMLIFSTLLGGMLWFWDEFWGKLFLGAEQPLQEWMLYTLHLCAMIVWLDNISAFPLVLMRAENRARLFVFAKLSGAVVQTLLTLLFLVWMGRGIPGIFEANVISAAVTLLICLPTILKRLKPAFSLSIVTACLAFGLPNLPNSLFVVVIELADRKILAALIKPAAAGLAEVGLYSAGYKLGLFLSIVAMGFRYAWQPFFLQISERPDAREVYGRVLTYYMTITVYLYLLLTAFIEPLAMWNIPGVGSLIDPEYWTGLKVFPVVLLAQLFNGAFAVFMVGVYLKKKMHAIPFITGIAAILNLSINFALVPHYGMWASAWATVAAYASMTILLYIYIQRYYPIPWEWKRLAHMALVGGVVYALSSISQRYGLDWIGYVLCISYPLMLLVTGLATPGEKARLRLKH